MWDSIRQSGLFGKSLTQGVVDSINAIVDTYYAHYAPVGDPEHLAYILATAYHESYHTSLNPQWLPVREGFASSNAGAVRAVTRLYEQGRISRNYALPQTNGHSYYGRGYVQITHLANYDRLGNRIGIDLVNFPDLALERITAAKLLVVGSVEGLYTGRQLSDYDTPDLLMDAYNARRVINGLDQAGRIKEYYNVFHEAIYQAMKNM